MKGRLFELPSGKALGQLEGHAHMIEDMAFSADGKKIITGAFDHTVAVWDRTTCKRLHSLTGFAEPVSQVALSDDGATAAAGNHKGLVKLWKATDGKLLRDLGGMKWAPGSMRFADDGKTLLVCTQEEGLLAWDVATGTRKVQNADVKGIGKLSPDGTCVAIVPQYKSIEPIVVWDLKSARPIAKIKGNQGGAFTVSFAPDNCLLATYGHDNILRYWKLPGGEEVGPPAGHQNRVTGLGFTRDGSQLISASADGTVRFWDGWTGKELKRLSAKNEFFHAMTLSADGKTLVLAGGGLPVHWRWGMGVDASKQSSSLRFFDIAAGKEARSFHLAGEMIGALRSTADGRDILAVGWSGLRLIDAATGKERDPGVRAQQGLPAGDITPDGRFIALSTDVPALRQIGKLAFIDTKDNKEVFSTTFYLGGYSGLAFSPDGRRLAVASSGHFRDKEMKSSPLQLWEVPSDNVVRNFETNEGNFHALVFSRDGRLLAAAREQRIDVFEVATGKRRHEFAGHEGGVGALAFSRDGQRLVSGGVDGCVTVWDLTGLSGKPVAKLEAKDLDQLWFDLSSADARTASAAIGRLASRPLKSTSFLRERLTVVNDADVKRMEALVVELDSDQFRIRDRAAKDLEKFGEAAVPVLKKALTGNSAEVRQTAERLLGRIGDGEDPVASPEARRTVRAVEILERIGTADAIDLLKDLRRRGGRLILHRDAEAALGRLERE